MDTVRKHEMFYKVIRKIIKPFITRKVNYSGTVVDVGSRPTLVVCNHVTDVDPILLPVSFPQHMYAVASEHIFRWGLPSKLIRYFFDPIPRFKGKIEYQTAMKALKALRSGTNVYLFPEGSKTFDGVSFDIVPSTGKLVKMSGADLVTYRLEGGYLNSPRWAKKYRKGHIIGHLGGRYSSDYLKGLSFEEINEIISRDIFEDAYESQMRNPVAFKGKDRAEYIELVLYVCPKCKEIASLKSEGNDFYCTCGLKGTYTEYGFLEGPQIEFSTIRDWNRWQRAFMEEYIDNMELNQTICSDSDQKLYSIQACEGNTLISEGELSIDLFALRCGDFEFPINTIVNMAICSRLILTFSTTDGNNYEINSDTPRSAFKYQTIVEIIKEKQKRKEEEAAV